MKRTILAAMLFASTSPALAQQPAPLPVEPKVAELRDAALKDDYAWNITEGLTTEVGQRLAGTAAEARARDWAVGNAISSSAAAPIRATRARAARGA